MHYFNPVSLQELLKAHLAGIRFDLSSLYYFNLLYIILHLIPGEFKNGKIYQGILFGLFITVNSLLVAANLVDTRFFDFEHKRLTTEIFSTVWVGEDFRTLLPQFIKDYWYLPVIWVMFIWAMVKLYARLSIKKILRGQLNAKLYSAQYGIFVFLMAIGILAGRGGFQLKPLRIIHAAKYTTAKNIPMVLNSPFTIMKSIGAEKIKTFTYFNHRELGLIFTPVTQYKGNPDKNTPNIVLIILESFSREYVGALNKGNTYTPFLDSLANEGLLFTRAFANGKRSIEALPSILSGIPALTDESYITSRYSSNNIYSIANVLSKKGYYTAFFHGGRNGTMGFDQFVYLSGFDKYFGMDEYPEKKHFDGHWGIYDQEYFNYFGKTISGFRKPFFATVFSLTSHHPYQVPATFKGKFPQGSLNIHESIGYTDYSLRAFFSLAKKTDWYDNTLFILVADHTAQAEGPYYNNSIGNYAIPILFFHPGDSLFRGKSALTAQQTDIFPTIMDYIGHEGPFICYGNSLLNDTLPHFTVNFINGIYQYMDDKYLIQFDGTKPTGFYNILTDSLLQHNLIYRTDEMVFYERKLKAIIQSYQERLIHNQLFLN